MLLSDDKACQWVVVIDSQSIVHKLWAANTQTTDSYIQLTTTKNMSTSSPTTNNNQRCQLAIDTCQAIERGCNNTSELFSILDIVANDTVPTPLTAHKQDDDIPNNKCKEILSIFYTLIGYHHNDNCNSSSTVAAVDDNNMDIPLSVKAHLLLKALLCIPHDRYAIPW